VPESSGYRTSSIWQLAAQRHTVWAHLALHGKDQLRQRVAFALSQIIAVGLITTGGSRVSLEKTEPFIELYDQFIRHGFGSYRDLMREFSFNVLMAEWLSFVDNKSLQWNILNGNGPTYPDENFAREIMQLFRCVKQIMSLCQYLRAYLLTCVLAYYCIMRPSALVFTNFIRMAAKCFQKTVIH
jgi:hypothetical protein